MHIPVLLIAMVPATYAHTINFEEPIANPDSVVTQYCAQDVEFIDESRIIEPPVTTMSPTRALTSDRGPGFEFEETRKIRIAFTSGQSEVSVRVGLDRNYPFIGHGVVAYLHAYSSMTADSGLVTYAATNLGNQATPINQLLRVISPAGDIRSIEIVFLGADAEQGTAFEVIDDLDFNALGPPCGGVDTDTPTITIENPHSDGTFLSTPRLDLAFPRVTMWVYPEYRSAFKAAWEDDTTAMAVHLLLQALEQALSRTNPDTGWDSNTRDHHPCPWGMAMSAGRPTGVITTGPGRTAASLVS